MTKGCPGISTVDGVRPITSRVQCVDVNRNGEKAHDMNRCITCKHREINGFCTKEDKIHEPGQGNLNQGEPGSEDHLIYDYHEEGCFWVGENFGCVHHERKS